MSRNFRQGILIAYMLLALGAPAMALFFPGQPPLMIKDELLLMSNGHFATPKLALGEGADSYEEDVLAEMDGVLAGASANYPDGGSALIARFVSAVAARQALMDLKAMIPHEKETKDLWATHFTSEGGEYVMITTVEEVLILIITDREALARERLAAVPAVIFNPRPGMGAVLAQQSAMVLALGLLFYGLIQLLLIANIKRWVQMANIESPSKA